LTTAGPYCCTMLAKSGSICTARGAGCSGAAACACEPNGP